MKLSRTVAYAVQAAVQLAQSESSAPVPCSQLAADGKMPERFLLQILRNLVTHGILRSTRGVEGGYMLTRAADQISLLDVIEAIEGPIDSGDPLSGDLPEVSQARLREALDEVTATSKKQLSAIKLSHLIPQPKTRSSKKEKHD
jgi:Rrf2 family protein